MVLKKQKGAQAVEFALMLPFMIVIIFAVIDFGILVYNKAVITNASREAARNGAMLTATAWDPDGLDNIKKTACDYAGPIVITLGSGTKLDDCSGTGDPQITVTPATAPAFNEPVRVDISYTFQGFTLGSWWNLGAVGAPLTLTSSTEMLHE